MGSISIGVDIGGTKTHLRSCLEQGMGRDLVVRTSEWRCGAYDHNIPGLIALISGFADGATPNGIAIGSHGCDDEAECAILQKPLSNHFACPLRVVNDAELFPLAMELSSGIGVVAGTGSIAVARDQKGRMHVAGGWGWAIGDEGSAPGLVREAGRAVRRHIDLGGARSEPLVEALCETFGLNSPTNIGTAIAKEGGASALGRHAPVIFYAANEGSSLAKRVIDEGAAALTQLVHHLKLAGVSDKDVVAGGGVILAQPLLANAFSHQISDRFGATVAVTFLDKPPVLGACVLARQLCSAGDGPETSIVSQHMDIQ
ncbi:MAG: sugar kinase [Mesorhizobium sp.]|nr:MAG: sugar kinase [Mesorhizobium sp.]RWJ09305.1 MAG: sugar kinase [Mesorhizobium sp.]RWJ81864.1 MAG: sugar kinase [Mesorhizobium sp.]